jgi:hypothetical protein
VGERGRILGDYRPTGAMPTFFDQLAGRGFSVDPRLFDPSAGVDVNVVRT